MNEIATDLAQVTPRNEVSRAATRKVDPIMTRATSLGKRRLLPDDPAYQARALAIVALVEKKRDVDNYLTRLAEDLENGHTISETDEAVLDRLFHTWRIQIDELLYVIGNCRHDD
ncbi:hypothetical protein ACLMJK_001387 [Lecanora helva]